MVERPSSGRGTDRDRGNRPETPEPAAIRTDRLNLVTIPPEAMWAILAGDWPGASRLLGAPMPDEWRRDSWEWLRQHAAAVERDPSVRVWGPRLLLRGAADRTGQGDIRVVGEAGFHGPPDSAGQLEIGYMVVVEHRRQGYAEEAATALLRWAADEPGVIEFMASVDPLNTPSLNLLRKLGFTETGRYRHDERGEQLLFRRRASQPWRNPSPDEGAG